MSKNNILFLLVPICAILLSATNFNNSKPVTTTLNFYETQLDSLADWCLKYQEIAKTANSENIKKEFCNGRAQYKKIEFIIEYHFPATANRINGAPLLEAEPSEHLEPVLPQGFQVLEEFVYDELSDENRTNISNEISNIQSAINKLQSNKSNIELTESNILDALRLNIYQMMIRGLSGFDAPAALSGIQEASVTLTTFKQNISSFQNTEKLIEHTNLAIRFIEKNDVDFNSFDRAIFIKDYLNPLCTEFYTWQKSSKIPFVKTARAIDYRAENLFVKNAFNQYFFAPAGTSEATTAQIQLGKKLFNDNNFSATQSRSCATCHQADQAFTDGLVLNESLSGGKKLLRNTPTLINAALQPSQFYDSRISFLEDQIHDVVTSKSEMDGNLIEIVSNLSNTKNYQSLFKKAYPNEGVSLGAVKKALAAYIRSLTSLNAPFDEYMRGNTAAMSKAQINGFNIFMAKGKCATCHFIPLFNGAFPPLYNKIESEVLGVPTQNDTVNANLDADLGKYNLYNIPHQRNAFKTVGLRNVAKTAPYMHNGVFKTLEEVIDFYDRGGGKGIGIELENQTLAPDKLNLSAQEKSDLVAFLQALSE